jgi:hypothetical protein
MRSLPWLRLVAAFLCVSYMCSAQTSAGSITGQVYDSSGAAVEAASVSITNLSTGRVTVLTTNGQGVYEAASLPAGTYTISVKRPGFSTMNVEGIKLDAGERINRNLTLQLGGVQQSVDVVANPTQVNTATGELSGTIESSQINRIEVNGRNYQAMLALIPGINNTSSGSQLSGLGLNNNFVVSSNGLATNKNVNMIDGSFNMNTGSEQGGGVNPELDTIREVRVLTNNYSARYGYSGGAQLLIETKSGERAFHGQAQEYLRNDAFDARNFFAPGVSSLKQNIFGFEIGGPVYIPHIYNSDRNKTFFFWGQNWRVIRQGLTLLGSTPTEEMRAGNFQAEAMRTGKNLIDPLSGAPFVNNIIPQSRIDPNAATLMNFMMPLPNNPSGGFQNYLNQASEKQKQQQEVIRLDHNFNDKFRVLLRYIQEDVYDTRPANQFSSSPFATIGDELDTFGKNAYLQVVNTVNPTTVNTFGFSYSQTQVEGLPTGNFVRPSGVTIRDYFPTANSLNYVPDLSFSGGWSPVGVSSAITLRDAPNLAYTFTDDLSKVIATHTLSMGLFYNMAAASQNTFATIQSKYSFNGTYTNDPIADFLVGQASTYSQDSQIRRGNLRYTQVEPYFQDDWKVSRRLTLNLGLRYSYLPPWYLQQPVTSFSPSSFDPTKAPQVTSTGILIPTSNYNPQNGLIYAGERQQGITQGFSKLDENLWQPRFGFAWDIFGNGKTAVRGGYGVTYTRTQDQIFNHLGNPPFVQNASLFNAPFSNPAGGSANPLHPSALAITPLDAVPMRVNSFSLGVEQQLGRNAVLHVTYAGNRVSRTPWTHDINQVEPTGGYDFDPRLNSNAIAVNALRPYQGYAGISGTFTDGIGKYNSLQASFVRRYDNNLSFQAAYTYGKSLGRGNDYGGAAQNTYNLSPDYGPYAKDRTHMLNLGYVYDLPFFKKQATIIDKLLGGWGLSGLILVESGFPYTATMATGTQGLATRANATGQLLFPTGTRTINEWFDTSAFTAPAAGNFGNSGVGTIRGPGLFDWDFSMTKRTSLYKDRVNSEFRASFFNVLNHTNLAGISTALGAGNFGKVTSALDPRIMEFGFKLWF